MAVEEKTSKVRILIVDDEEVILNLSKRGLTRVGYDVKTAANGASALKILEQVPIDIVISDLKMDVMDGLELLKHIKRDYPHIEVIMMTGYASVENAIESMKLGAYDFLLKPLKIEQMRLVVSKCAEKIAMSREVSELRKVKEKLEELQQIKDKFIAITSHELRTPVTHAKSYFQFLEDDMFSEEEKKEFIRIISNALNDLERIVLDMFNMSRIESRELKLKKEIFDLNKVAEDVLKELQLDLQGRDLTILFEPKEDLPEIVADRFYMRRIFQELVSNAIRFTQDGGTIRVSIDKEEKYFLIRVTDSGVGIPEEDLGHIFEKFYEVQNSDYHSSSKRGFLGGSTGIGLPLIRGIVDAHNGYVKIDSKLGEGTTVSVYLPQGSLDDEEEL